MKKGWRERLLVAYIKLAGQAGQGGQQPFVRLAEEDRARYAREMDAYTPSAAFLAELADAKTDPKHGESGTPGRCAVVHAVHVTALHRAFARL